MADPRAKISISARGLPHHPAPGEGIDLVGEIPDNVWQALTPEEKTALFAIGDAARGRFSAAVMRTRLDKIHALHEAVGR